MYKNELYWFNRQEIQQKAKERYSKEKAAEYHLRNKEAIKKNQESVIKACHKKEKTRLRSIKEESIKNLFSIKKKCYKINNFFVCLQYKKNEWKHTKI